MERAQKRGTGVRLTVGGGWSKAAGDHAVSVLKTAGTTCAASRRSPAIVKVSDTPLAAEVRRRMTNRIILRKTLEKCLYQNTVISNL